MKREIVSLLFLLLFIAIALSVELLGGWFTQLGLVDWYPEIKKPSWTPPNWLFGPVWTLLYLLMGVALWLVWRAPPSPLKKGAYWLFGAQLFTNLIWSALFFTLHSPLSALIDLLLLWLLIVGTIVTFYRVRPLAAYLLLPYLIWTSYALALNGAIWQLNR